MQPGTSVFILTPLHQWRPLVFHAGEYWRTRENDQALAGGWIRKRWAQITRCGRERYWNQYEELATVHHDGAGRVALEFRNECDWTAVAIRLDRAQLIAQPCSRCFPRGRIA